MSHVAVETCPCFALPSRFGRGFLGPLGLFRNARRLTRSAKSSNVAAISGALMRYKTSHSPSGIAIIIPWDVVATSLAREESDTASSTVCWPCTPRHAAHTTANTLEATHARQKPNNAALGYPNVLISE